MFQKIKPNNWDTKRQVIITDINLLHENLNQHSVRVIPTGNNLGITEINAYNVR